MRRRPQQPKAKASKPDTPRPPTPKSPIGSDDDEDAWLPPRKHDFGCSDGHDDKGGALIPTTTASASDTRLLRRSAVFVAAVAVAVFSNSLHGGLCLDDEGVIAQNADVTGHDTIAFGWWGAFWQGVPALLANDYWGTPLAHTSSHKSYRPLTVMTFRANHMLATGGAGKDSKDNVGPLLGYHMVNVVLHAAVSALLVLFAHAEAFGCNISASAATKKDTRSTQPNRRRRYTIAKCLSTGLLFALHPVHAEAVAGLAGRAEPLSAVFFLGGLLAASRARRSDSEIASLGWAAGAVAFAVLATAAKEAGIMLLPVAIALELLPTWDAVRQRLAAAYGSSGSGTAASLLARGAALRLVIFGFGLAQILAARIALMGTALPSFGPADNPAAAPGVPVTTRALTQW